ncbi:MAG: PepSY-associated TM helix domain-containing protein [Bryobacterales bacterium]|nr:PepSY-associated TM helix domain-containing protein [Bryobacterales bacterium]
MFRWMRNIHLALGVSFFLVALLFALSSTVLMYRSWFPKSVDRTNASVRLEPGLDGRAAALALMRMHGITGDLYDIRAEGSDLRFRIARPGTEAAVAYSPATGEAKLETRRYNFYEMLVQLHTNHGFWHDTATSNAWALLSLGVSIGLLLLGASGIYLWYKHPKERLIGNILLAIGFAVPAVALLITRLQGS